MDSDLETSRFSVLFGEEPDPDTCSKINLSIDFSQKLAKQSLDTLKASSNGKIDLDKTLVVEIMTDSPENAQELITFIDEVQNGEKEAMNKKYGDMGGKTWHLANKIFAMKIITLKACIHSTDSRRVMISIQGSEKVKENILEPITTLLDSGLSKISDNKGNSVELNVQFSKFEPLVEKFLSSQNISAAFFSKIKLDGKILLCKDLAKLLSAVFDKIDPDFNQSPPMMFVKYFKMVDVDLRFNSIDDLPKEIKHRVLNPFKNVFTFSADEKVDWNNNKFFGQMKKLIGGQVIAHANLNNFMALKLDIKLPGLTKLFDVLFAGFKERPFIKLGLAKPKNEEDEY